jgi:hypothetical protein
MNSDDEDRLVSNGDIRSAYYLRSGSSNDQNAGGRSTYLGNTQAFNDGLAAGENTVIGSAKHTKNNSIIFMYHNSLGSHSIWLYNVLSGVWSKILESETLNFSLDFPIKTARVIGGLLFLTDGRDNGYYSAGIRLFNPPYSINIQDGIDGLYTTVDLQSIDAAKYPPFLPPRVRYSTINNTENRLVGLMFDFCYAYIYDDNEETTYSNVSEKPVPTQSQFTTSYNYGATFADNVIKVTINTGHYKVKKIKVAVRVNDTEFQVFQEINKAELGLADNTVYTIDFLNNVVLYPLSNLLEPYNQVPQTAKYLEVLPENQIAYGNFKEDYDNVEMDYSIGLMNHEILNYNPNQIALETKSYTYGNIDEINNYILIKFAGDAFADRPFSFAAGDSFLLSFSYAYEGITATINHTVVLPQSEISYARTLAAAGLQNNEILRYISQSLTDRLNNEDIALWTMSINTADGGYMISSNVVDNWILNGTEWISVYSQRLSGVEKTIKKGWTYYFGIQYRDAAARSGTVQLIQDPSVRVPYPCQLDRSAFDNPDNPYYVTPTVDVNNAPPIWAATYDIVIRKVKTSSEQRSLFRITTDSTFPGTYKLEPENWFETNRHGNISHQYQDGDRIRFVSKNFTVTTTPKIQGPAPYTESYIDLPILKYDPAGGIDGREAFWVPIYELNQTRTSASDGQLIEIYTPNFKSDVSPWYVISSNSIENAHADLNRFHSGSIETPKPVTITAGSSTLVVAGDFGDAVGYYLTLAQTGYTYTGLITSATYDSANQTTILNVGGLFPILPTAAITIDYSQTTLKPARLRLDWGDNYFRQRIMASSYVELPQLYYYVEDPFLSDFFDSGFYSWGQVAIQSSNNQARQRTTGIINSAKYIPDSQINGLNTFQGLDIRQVMNQKSGPITGLAIDGKTLHVVQNYETTPLYCGSTYAVDAVGDVAQPAFSGQTFGGRGTPVPFGTFHPLSVQLIEGNLFMYDMQRACVAVLTNGGHQAITSGNFKFNFWTNEKTIDVRANFDSYKIFGFVDQANGEYLLSFTNEGVTDTPVFKYNEAKWDHFVTYPVHWAETLESFLMSTPGEQLYLHNQGNPSEYYETVYTPSLTFEMNDNPSIIKRLYAIGLKANNAFDLSLIKTKGNLTYSEMTSQIPAEAFAEREGYLWAGYLRDQTNIVPQIPSLATAELALMNGRELRAPMFEHKLEFTAGGSALIMSAKIMYEASNPAI